MNTKPLFPLSLALLLLTALGCKETATPTTPEPESEVLASGQEKLAILATLNNETKAAFQRDYEAWQDNWVQDPDITKIYLNFADSTFSESLGWEDINQFVKTYFEDHPEPEPIPEPLTDIDVRLYGDGAWVTYQQHDSIRGLKRETRLMEKVNGEWKIAGMQTTIYGFKVED